MQKVLIVDDNKTLQKIIAKIVAPLLEVQGFASDGNEAFAEYKKLRPDIVLLDVTMPNCNGKQALEMILKYDPSAKIIMVSGLTDQSTTQECLKIGAKAFVNKNQISLQNVAGENPLILEIKSVLSVSQLQKAA